jgi:hypothetical protein
MGIRETLNEKRRLAAGIAATCVCACVLLVVWEMKGDAPPPTQQSNKAFFTDDGVKTFVDDVSRIPPFEHNGKQAIRAYLFTCDGGRTKFIGYLERLPKDSKTRLEAIQKNPAAANDAMGMRVRSTIVSEVKKPNDAKWVMKDSPEGAKVLDITCPNGKQGDPQPVIP